jgi:hypothetical protein
LPRTPARSVRKNDIGKTESDLYESGPKMIANALLLTIALLLAYMFWLMDELKFMAPYKAVLIHTYGSLVLISSVVLFLNVFGAVLLLQRKFFLKDTGRKLSHLDQQFQIGPIELPIAPETEEKE